MNLTWPAKNFAANALAAGAESTAANKEMIV